ncbi:MAG: Ig-like domain-containing protein [Verrucomicrobia bacterium]|nr:Ig-like domain-containing protein [Verrucomicrobiota bacterium]
MASDPDGTVTKVEFYDGANLVGSATASPYNFNWLNVPAGTHSLTARATDNQGAVTTSAAVSVRVGAVGTPVFWRGINFGGNAVNIEGNQWMGQAAAEANGLTFPTRPFTSTSTVTPVPAAAGDLNTMLNSCAWAQNGFTISQAVSNGDYQVYFWVMENYQANFRDITFKVEGSIVATQVGKGWTVGQWSKYGPFDVTVTDGVLSVDLTKVAWDPEVMGMAIYRVQAANNHAPTVTLTAPSDGATLAGPANIALSATATDGDGAVSRVEFYSGSTKLVEKTSAPYTFSVTNVLPGNYAFLAVAYDNLGTVTISTTAFVTVVSPSVGANALLGDGKFQLALPAVAGATNSVEATTNLTNWVVLTNVIGGVSNQLFTDAQATNFARRFYRVRVNGVLTSNTVGFARVAVPPGYTIIANPLVPATNKVGAIFRGVPNGTTLAQFRNASNDYAVNSYDEAFNVWDDPDQPFGLGDATFILNPGTTNFTVAFSGTLPAGTQTRALPHGYQMSGVSWPQDGLLQVAHGYVPSDGDIVYRYRSNRYLISQYFAAFGAWDIEPDVKVGEGFFIFRATAGNWTRTFSLGQ